jgi:hypothetical protein
MSATAPSAPTPLSCPSSDIISAKAGVELASQPAHNEGIPLQLDCIYASTPDVSPAASVTLIISDAPAAVSVFKTLRDSGKPAGNYELNQFESTDTSVLIIQSNHISGPGGSGRLGGGQTLHYLDPFVCHALAMHTGTADQAQQFMRYLDQVTSGMCSNIGALRQLAPH